MKIEIDYFVNKGSDHEPCAAQSEWRGKAIVGIGKTWEAARDRVVAQIKQLVETKVPPRETVVLPELETEEDEKRFREFVNVFTDRNPKP